MVHFGILCPAASGHLNPMTALGYELRQRGHQVTVVGLLDAKSKALAAGLDFRAIGEVAFPFGAIPNAVAKLGQLEGLAAFRYTVELFKQTTLTLLQEAPAALQSAGVEALLIDQTSSGGSTVAEFLDLPFISVCCALMLNRDPNVPPFNTTWNYHAAGWARIRNQLGHELMSRIARPIINEVVAHRQRWNLPTYRHPNDAFSKLAQLCQQPAEFEFPRQHLPACFHFTGPYSNPASREPSSFPFEQLTGKPLIYASLGTIQNQLLGTFQVIAEACQELDAQLVIALGGGSKPESLPALPGSPLVVEYAPQLELLQRATLTITHAGMNTTLESLANGVPMVAIPIANDQPGVAARIAWTGTGEVVPLKRLSSSKLRSAIGRVLSEKTYRENALRMQVAIRQAGGIKRAIDIVEQVVATGKPVRSRLS
ncbi:glycosyltransferase [Gloeocapsopsis crepidinum LEGE 06123]|uniref:Glycosyltransferase n=1 Tax=Gloeocapsopsis crepidinum LEGE 06123 TaxID=588587 RepID=A0ABR9UXU9_9CHRO|nr:glycosyltransferase [Gloeocapsopsis crepidinum]MBE9193143.1 glycosyltransferase [Gloeocapsopsis crepidinum LEGE 06123]